MFFVLLIAVVTSNKFVIKVKKGISKLAKALLTPENKIIIAQIFNMVLADSVVLSTKLSAKEYSLS